MQVLIIKHLEPWLKTNVSSELVQMHDMVVDTRVSGIYIFKITGPQGTVYALHVIAWCCIAQGARRVHRGGLQVVSAFIEEEPGQSADSYGPCKGTSQHSAETSSLTPTRFCDMPTKVHVGPKKNYPC